MSVQDSIARSTHESISLRKKTVIDILGGAKDPLPYLGDINPNDSRWNELLGILEKAVQKQINISKAKLIGLNNMKMRDGFITKAIDLIQGPSKSSSKSAHHRQLPENIVNTLVDVIAKASHKLFQIREQSYKEQKSFVIDNDDFEDDDKITDLKNKVSRLESEISNLQINITSLQNSNFRLENDLKKQRQRSEQSPLTLLSAAVRGNPSVFIKSHDQLKAVLQMVQTLTATVPKDLNEGDPIQNVLSRICQLMNSSKVIESFAMPQKGAGT